MKKQDAILYGQVATAAYTGNANLSNFKLLGRFENKATDTQGIFGVANNDTFVLGFRGSEETGIADWITDLKIVQQISPYAGSNPDVKVHYGFNNAYQSVRDAVLGEAKKTPHKKIVCTGHSLGGALATLAAVDLQYNLPDKDVSCYTYGCPKVGNTAFATSYNKRVPNTFRFVNGIDKVPLLPPVGYEHTGKLYEVGKSVSAWLDALTGAVEAHFPNNYLKALQDLVDD